MKIESCFFNFQLLTIMRIIDTHAHLDDPQYADDLPEVVERARLAGVEKVLLANVNIKDKDRVQAVADAYPGFCYAMMGIHPEEIREDYREQLEAFDREVSKRRYIAIGEIGMDLYFDRSFKAEQQEAFRHQVAVAVDMGLPVAVHSREAFQITYDILSEFDKNRLRGVWHCFSLTPEQSRMIFKLGDFYVGIGGVSTFKNAKFSERLPEIPIDRVLLETDCPYLAPTPLRGKRNEPSYLTYVAQRLSTLYGLSVADVCEITSRNAEKLFF